MLGRLPLDGVSIAAYPVFSTDGKYLYVLRGDGRLVRWDYSRWYLPTEQHGFWQLPDESFPSFMDRKAAIGAAPSGVTVVTSANDVVTLRTLSFSNGERGRSVRNVISCEKTKQSVRLWGCPTLASFEDCSKHSEIRVYLEQASRLSPRRLDPILGLDPHKRRRPSHDLPVIRVDVLQLVPPCRSWFQLPRVRSHHRVSAFSNTRTTGIPTSVRISSGRTFRGSVRYRSSEGGSPNRHRIPSIGPLAISAKSLA